MIMARPTTYHFVAIFIILFCCSSSCFARKHSHHHHHHHRHHHRHHHHHHHRHRHHKTHNATNKPAVPVPDKAEKQVLNIEAFGAKADEKTDNSQAFKKAWEKACNSSESPNILVPNGKIYYVKHINFTGPCHSGISLEIQGSIKSFPQMYDIPRRLWIQFEDVKNLSIFGGGTVDGNGEVWWKNSCKIKKTEPCQSQSAPTALTFKNCTNLKLSNLKLLNAQQMHVNFQDCNVVEASKLLVVAPEDSPNTDGIHVTRTSNINILESEIRTGDDCISIVNGSRNVEMRDINCGPGHGISIGSLGEDNTENHVSNIRVKGAVLTGTTNGVRIKTWQGGSGNAKNIVFEDIVMRNVHNPILINQYYCDKNKKCDEEKSGVQVENVIYRNIRGTSASKVAINFNCSESVPCKNLVLQNVMLTAQQKGAKVEASCSHLAMQTSNLNSFPSCSANY